MLLIYYLLYQSSISFFVFIGWLNIKIKPLASYLFHKAKTICYTQLSSF